MWDAVRAPGFGPILPYQTTNSYGVGLLRVQDTSERLLRIFSALPPKEPVAVFLLDADDRSLFLSYLVSYFAWPREVQSIPVTRANASTHLQALDRTAVAAIIFCGLEPPPTMHPIIRIGSGLAVVPRSATPEAHAP